MFYKNDFSKFVETHARLRRVPETKGGENLETASIPNTYGALGHREAEKWAMLEWGVHPGKTNVEISLQRKRELFTHHSKKGRLHGHRCDRGRCSGKQRSGGEGTVSPGLNKT